MIDTTYVMREPVDNDVLQPPTMPGPVWLNHESRREAMLNELTTFQGHCGHLTIVPINSEADVLRQHLAAVTAERDMLARRLQELTQPAPDMKFEALSDAVTNAVRVMQRSGIR